MRTMDKTFSLFPLIITDAISAGIASIKTALSGSVTVIAARIPIEPAPAPSRSEPYNSPDFSLIEENAAAIISPVKRTAPKEQRSKELYRAVVFSPMKALQDQKVSDLR